MGKSSKPKTPEHERIQAAMSADKFDQGSGIRAAIGADLLGDMRYDSSSKDASQASAANAVRQKQEFIASRKTSKTKYAGDSFDKAAVDGAAMVAKGGRDVARGAKKVADDNSRVMQVGSIMSKMDSDQAIEKMYQSNAKTQMAIDTVGIAANSAIQIKDKATAAKLAKKEMELLKENSKKKEALAS